MGNASLCVLGYDGEDSRENVGPINPHGFTGFASYSMRQALRGTHQPGGGAHPHPHGFLEQRVHRRPHPDALKDRKTLFTTEGTGYTEKIQAGLGSNDPFKPTWPIQLSNAEDLFLPPTHLVFSGYSVPSVVQQDNFNQLFFRLTLPGI